MLKKLLAERGVILTKELSDMVVVNIKFNRIKFNKCTSLKELLIITERHNKALNKCA